jgi:hypothetical protein
VDLGELLGILSAAATSPLRAAPIARAKYVRASVNGSLLAIGLSCAAAFQSPRSMARRAGIAAAA